EKLYEQAKRQMASTSFTDHQAALDGPVKQYLARYGSVPGDMTEQMKRWSEDVQVEEKEDLIARYLNKKGAAIKFNVPEEDRDGCNGADDELEGNLTAARKRWEEIEKNNAQAPWRLTAGRRLRALDAVDSQDQRWRETLGIMAGNSREPEMSDLERDAFRAYRAEHLGDPYQKEGEDPDADKALAYQLYENVREHAKKEPDKRFWFLVAAKGARDLKDSKGSDPDKVKKERKAMVERAVTAARELASTNVEAAGLTCMNRIAGSGK